MSAKRLADYHSESKETYPNGVTLPIKKGLMPSKIWQLSLMTDSNLGWDTQLEDLDSRAWWLRVLGPVHNEPRTTLGHSAINLDIELQEAKIAEFFRYGPRTYYLSPIEGIKFAGGIAVSGIAVPVEGVFIHGSPAGGFMRFSEAEAAGQILEQTIN